MVVHYASGGEGSWTSIFTTLPRILVKMEGSVLPHITPQLVIVAGLGVLSTFWNPLEGEDGDDSDLKLQPAMSVRARRDHLASARGGDCSVGHVVMPHAGATACCVRS